MPREGGASSPKGGTLLASARLTAGSPACAGDDRSNRGAKDVDGRDKLGHDEFRDHRTGDTPGAKFCTFCRSRTFIFMPLLMMMSPGF